MEQSMEPLRATCDQRGRMYLDKKLRDDYGSDFIVVRAPGRLIFLPVPKDPLKDFQELGKKLPDMTVAQLKREIRKQALKDALGGYVRRH